MFTRVSMHKHLRYSSPQARAHLCNKACMLLNEQSSEWVVKTVTHMSGHAAAIDVVHFELFRSSQSELLMITNEVMFEMCTRVIMIVQL